VRERTFSQEKTFSDNTEMILLKLFKAVITDLYFGNSYKSVLAG